jgi:hypothetical protein
MQLRAYAKNKLESSQKKKKSLNPMPLPPRGDLDPVNEKRQIFRAQALAGSFSFWPAKSAFLQAFCANEQPRTVPKQNLEPVARFIGEYEPMAAVGILLQHRLHPRIKAIETLAHVHRFQGHKNPRSGG